MKLSKTQTRKSKITEIESINGELIDKDGQKVIYETIYEPSMDNLMYAVFIINSKGKTKIDYWPEITDNMGRKLIPPLSQQGAFRAEALKTASKTLPYVSREDLWKEGYEILKDFAYLPEDITRILAWILLYYNIWDHPAFRTCSYLVIRGFSGKGKNRILDIFRECCLRTLNLGNSPSVPVLYRAPEGLKPILLLDEVVWDPKNPNYNDYNSIWNSGFQKTGSVPRMEKDTSGIFKTKYFNTFGPKIAIIPGELPPGPAQSRCVMITLPSSEEGFKNLFKRRQKEDLNTIELSSDFFERAMQFKNKALTWRLENWSKIQYTEKYVNLDTASCRLFQAINPMLSMINDQKINEEIINYMKKLEDVRKGEEINDLDIAILKAMHEMLTSVLKEDLIVGTITAKAKEHLTSKGIELDFKITPAKVGRIIKNKLLFDTIRTRNGSKMLTNYADFQEHIKTLGVEKEICPDENQNKKSN
jgi:hypothetical protein